MIEELISQYDAKNFSEWCRSRFDHFTGDLHPLPDAGGFAKAEIVGYVQSLTDTDVNRPLLVISVHAGRQLNERSSRRRQFDFARKQLQAALDKPPAKVKGLFTQGLFAFHDDDGNFRLSLVAGRAEGRKLVYGDFKRYSFFVRPDRNNKTFRDRMAAPFATYAQLAAAFSVETLTKEFYNSLFAWYERAMAPEAKVTFPNDLTRDDDDRSRLAEHLIRLITRLMFIWFIRQKNLIPDAIFDPAALKALLKSFDPLSPKQDNYYRAILQNLFFATLNCEIAERDFAKEGSFEANKEHFGIKLLYRYRDAFTCTPEEVVALFRQVPFLNGGLFECLDNKTDYQDGFSRNPKRVAHIPNNLFFDDRGLITLFSRYDFTVDENDPNDSDVALDPELLGKVFENLLGAYNPETRETARKQSGSFYTPREIVNYMVDESLVAHIRTQAPEIEEPVIRQFLGGEPPPDLANPLRNKLVAALYHCRILDPACGSGAFPMGLLLKMVHLLQRLDPKNALWHEVVMAEAEKALTEAETLDAAEKRQRRQRITDSFDQNVNQPDYARKLYLIENCIFGVDIQPIAVQIAKLRTFITLVCDQEPDLADAARNYRMLPLPNLETKFVAANSLIGLSVDFAEGLKPAEGGSRLDDAELVRLRAELAEVRHRHFRARSAQEKNGCRRRDGELRGRIKTRLVAIACRPDQDKIARYRSEIATLQGRRKRVEGEDWRDVVQSRPTQGSLFDSDPPPVQTVMRLDVNKEARDRADDEIRRVTRAIQTEENRAKNKSAFQEEADRLADWDPYDQNRASPFFDPKWMFDVRTGFDIVIGNPPYMQVPKGVLDAATFPYSEGKDSGKQNLYKVFAEHSYNMAGGSATICMIVQSSLMCDVSAKHTRELLLTHTQISAIVEFPKVAPNKEGQVFEAVLQGTCIFSGRKAAPSQDQTFALSVNNDVTTITGLECSRISQAQILDCYPFGFCIPLVRIGEFDIIRGIHSRSTPFAQHISALSQGDVNLTAAKPHITMRPTGTKLIRGRNVSRYRINYDVDEYIAHKWREETAKVNRTQSCIVCQEVTGTVDVRRLHFAPSEPCICVYGHSTNKIVLSQGFSRSFALGLMNSKLMDWYFRKTSTNNHVCGYEIEQLPICGENTPEARSIAVLADAIIAAKKQDPTASTADEERQIDHLVYGLYGLTEDEIAIVEGRDAAARPTKPAARPAKPSAGRQPRKSVMTEDPDLE